MAKGREGWQAGNPEGSLLKSVGKKLDFFDWICYPVPVNKKVNIKELVRQWPVREYHDRLERKIFTKK